MDGAEARRQREAPECGGSHRAIVRAPQVPPHHPVRVMAAARASANLRLRMLVRDPTPVERGKAARKAAPRRSHAEFAPAPGRTDPVEQLERQARTRVPELVPI